jgi:RNA polymerase sigma-70 factor, ECF subfamily
MADSVTSLLVRLREGDRSALNPLITLVYPELHKIAAGYLREERPSHIMQPTVLVHEAYLRLVRGRSGEYQNRAHFFGVAASLMRQILVDHARSQSAAKRGGYSLTLGLDESLDAAATKPPDIIAIDEALRSLAAKDECKSRLVELRFFGGLTAEEISEFESMSVHRVRHEIRLALAWLHREVS